MLTRGRLVSIRKWPGPYEMREEKEAVRLSAGRNSKFVRFPFRLALPRKSIPCGEVRLVQ